MEPIFEPLTFDNCERAREIDRSDIPEDFVDGVPALIETLRFGYEHKLIGYSFLVNVGERPVGTILLGQGLYCEGEDPPEVEGVPFYRLVFFIIDRAYRSRGLGSRILAETIERVFRDFGERPIVLGVHRDNMKAMRFYERQGFTKTPYTEGNDCVFIR
ncbi:MAG: GNAT family N-acetyltransferase [Ruminococcus sp.]|nr:GNAT family N-acetyltransferase [Ruminococcus sp.]